MIRDSDGRFGGLQISPGVFPLIERPFQLDQLPVLDLHGGGVDVFGALALGAVHQRVGPVDQLRGELAGHAAALGDRPELQADDADVDPHRAGGQSRRSSRVQSCASTASLKRSAISNASSQPGRSGNQEAELVAAEPGVQVAPFAGALERQEVLGADLVGQDARDALDDAVAGRVPERVVVPLEAS